MKFDATSEGTFEDVISEAVQIILKILILTKGAKTLTTVTMIGTWLIQIFRNAKHRGESLGNTYYRLSMKQTESEPQILALHYLFHL